MLKAEESSAPARRQRPAGDVRILTGAEIPVAALDSFYEQSFPARSGFLKRNWRWLYRAGDGTSTQGPIVAMMEDRVVGHLGVIPVRLRRGHEERAAAWACDIAVLPECRGRSVGPLLLSTMMSAHPLRIGFPNELSVKVTHKLGWGHESHTLGLSLLLRLDRHPKVRRLSTAKRGVSELAALAGFAARVISRVRTWPRKRLSVSPATADHLAIFSEETPARLHATRSAEFLRWRILDHPRAGEYVVLSLPNGGGERHSAIARVIEHGGYRRLHLLALRAGRSNQSGLSDFFASVIRWALDQDLHVISLVTSDPSVASVAKWWLPVPKPVRYAYHADDPAGKAFLGGTDHCWEYLDNDFDLIYVSRNSEA